MEESLGLPRLNCGRGGIKASVTICCVVCVERNVDCCGENAPFCCVFSPLCVLWHTKKTHNKQYKLWAVWGFNTDLCNNAGTPVLFPVYPRYKHTDTILTY